MKKMTSMQEKESYGKAFGMASKPMTEKMDAGMDKKAGVKENSKRDLAMDKKAGVMRGKAGKMY
jgi:hypothetical protein